MQKSLAEQWAEGSEFSFIPSQLLFYLQGLFCLYKNTSESYLYPQTIRTRPSCFKPPRERAWCLLSHSPPHLPPRRVQRELTGLPWYVSAAHTLNGNAWPTLLPSESCKGVFAWGWGKQIWATWKPHLVCGVWNLVSLCQNICYLRNNLPSWVQKERERTELQAGTACFPGCQQKQRPQITLPEH